jgi:hypothetical protein
MELLMLKHTKEKKILRFIAFNLFLFFIAVYLLTASGLNFYDTDASQIQIDVAKSIVENFDISITDGVGIIGVDGRKYSWLGVGSAILAVPFYYIGELIGIPPENALSVMNQLFGAATVVLIFLFAIALGYSRRASLLISIFYGLGTFAWPLAKQPFDHPIETFFILLSVYSLYLYVTNRKISNLLFSSLSLGFAFITRPTSILVILPLLIMLVFYSVKRFDRRTVIKKLLRDTVMFSLVFLPFLGLNLWYNYYRFGSIFETGYTLLSARTGIDYFRGTSLLTGLSGFLISPGKGFFYYSPVAIFFFFSIKSFLKRYPGLGISFIFIMLLYLLLLSKYVYWPGDMAWGPRYLFVITPFLIIPIAEIFDSDVWIKKNILRLAVYSIFVLSFIVQIAAVSVDFLKYFSELQKKVDFIKVPGDGFLQINIPPSETYFAWNKSPILAQFRFIREIAEKMKDGRYSKPSEDTSNVEKHVQRMNLFDFWWVYKYYIGGSYSGFVVALILLLLAIHTAVKLSKISSRGLMCHSIEKKKR